MKKTLLLTFLIMTVLLAACAPAAQPTPPPTQQPVPPTAKASSAGQDTLTGTTWMWIGFTDPNQQYGVENPMNYSLVFNEDGTLEIKADCNNASGTYQTDAGALTITIGSMTRAMCPPESRSDEYLKYLGSSARYFFQDGNLYIDLMADGGTMVFATSDVVMADDGEGALSGALHANPWQWVSFTNPVDSYQITDPASYVVTFNADGTLNIKADCNNAGGTYKVAGSSLTITVGPSTLAACPAGSRSDDFIKYLGSAAHYFFKDGDLFIDLMADGGTMRFTP